MSALGRNCPWPSLMWHQEVSWRACGQTLVTSHDGMCKERYFANYQFIRTDSAARIELEVTQLEERAPDDEGSCMANSDEQIVEGEGRACSGSTTIELEWVRAL